jgi:hypothetical protein
MRLGSLVCGLLISIIYLMDFLYLQRGLESRPCREIFITYLLRLRETVCFVDPRPPTVLWTRDRRGQAYFSSLPGVDVHSE